MLPPYLMLCQLLLSSTLAQHSIPHFLFPSVPFFHLKEWKEGQPNRIGRGGLIWCLRPFCSTLTVAHNDLPASLGLHGKVKQMFWLILLFPSVPLSLFFFFGGVGYRKDFSVWTLISCEIRILAATLSISWALPDESRFFPKKTKTFMEIMQMTCVLLQHIYWGGGGKKPCRAWMPWPQLLEYNVCLCPK